MPASLLGKSWLIMGVVDDSREVLTRPAMPPDVILRYGPRDDQVVDVRLPRRTNAPLVVLLHGGFWRVAWDRVHLRPMADALATAGFAVAVPEYARTGGGGGWPVTFDDIALAVNVLPGLVAHTVGTAFDPTRIVLAGHSAGGQLALWCAGHGLPLEYVGVVALAPVADLAEAFRLDLDGGAVRELLGAGPDEVPDRYARTDPTRLPAPAVPVIVVHGSDDSAVPPQLSERYAMHTAAELRLLDGVGHFELIDPRSAAWPVVHDAIRGIAHRPR
ncbi:MAG TPA: alpha/beta hydrolase [Jiangellaceae bacterium]